MNKPRWTITTITTTDVELVKLTAEVREHGYRHEDIWRKGVEAYAKIIKDKK